MIEKLIRIQSELKAPKGQINKFGNYRYRSCEDIIEAVKPLLAREGLAMIISDDIVEIGGRNYVKAIVRIYDTKATNVNGEYASSQAFAREEETKKGMDAAQITGAASSYARKYALNGMFAIDDTKDADATETHGKKEEADYEDDDVNFD